MVRAFKLSQKSMREKLDVLLDQMGAVHNGRAYTGYTFFSEADLTTIRRNHRRSLRTEYPRAKKSNLDEQTDQYFNQFATNDSLAKALKPGYVLVDFDGIGRSIQMQQEQEEAANKQFDSSMSKLTPFYARFFDGIVNFFKANFGEPQRS